MLERTKVNSKGGEITLIQALIHNLQLVQLRLDKNETISFNFQPWNRGLEVSVKFLQIKVIVKTKVIVKNKSRQKSWSYKRKSLANFFHPTNDITLLVV